ncbi:hypothetical protein PLA106_28011, partial [Pseudomonas amygdali pv. lachrymans str. M302278]
MAAEFEEIVAATDLPDFQHIGPDSCQLLLQF